jgi:uncharacterized protein YneF (UPF0154 family)
MPLTTPTWIAAIATVVLAIGVLIAVYFARKAFQAQSRQLRSQHEINEKLAEAIPLQTKELHESLDERRRVQAAQVFIELDRVAPPASSSTAAETAPWRLTLTVHNTSKQPVYDLYVIWQLGTVRMGKPDPMARLMPGCDASFERRGPQEATDPAALGAFVAFRDAAGIRWAVREDGTLTDIALPSQDT